MKNLTELLCYIRNLQANQETTLNKAKEEMNIQAIAIYSNSINELNKVGEQVQMMINNSPNNIVVAPGWTNIWEGWRGNHDSRIEGATCSECGYENPIIKGKEGIKNLPKICPQCQTVMQVAYYSDKTVHSLNKTGFIDS